MINLEKQQRLRRNFEQFVEQLPKKELFLSAIDDLLEEIRYLENQKAVSSDLEKLYLLVQEGFKNSNSKFEALQRQFEVLQKQMDERFVAVQKQIDERFVAVQKQMDERFIAVQKQMDERFTAIDKRFEDINRHLGRLQWLVGIGFVLLSFLMAWLDGRAS